MLKENKKLKWHIGLRVAVLKANAGKKDDKKFLGYGTITGTKEISIFGKKHKVPHIEFDNKLKTLFGYECWWMPEQDYKNMLKNTALRPSLKAGVSEPS